MRDKFESAVWHGKQAFLLSCDRLRLSPRLAASLLGGIACSLSFVAVSDALNQPGVSFMPASTPTAPCPLVSYVTTTTQKTVQMATAGIGGTDSRKYFNDNSASGCLKLISTLPVDMSMAIPSWDPLLVMAQGMLNAAKNQVLGYINTTAMNLIGDVTTRYNNLLTSFHGLGTLFDSASKTQFTNAIASGVNAANTTISATYNANVTSIHTSNPLQNAANSVANTSVGSMPTNCMTVDQSTKQQIANSIDQMNNNIVSQANQDCALNGCAYTQSAYSQQQAACATYQQQQLDPNTGKMVTVTLVSDPGTCNQLTQQIPVMQQNLASTQQQVAQSTVDVNNSYHNCGSSIVNATNTAQPTNYAPIVNGTTYQQQQSSSTTPVVGPAAPQGSGASPTPAVPAVQP